jgi:Uma2 family endonuclease
MAEAARSLFTYHEYLDVEQASPIRHEFLGGVVYAMAGGSPEHAGIAANVIRLLGNALGARPCRVFTTDLRVRCVETGLATYPDLSVVCGSVELDPEDPRGHTATNPSLLVEVLSPSTEAYDRGDKLSHYKRIPSVREVALVAHDDRRVDLWRRTDRGWTQLVFREGDALTLESIGCVIPVADVYFDALAP